MILEFQFIPRTTAGVNARTLCSKEQWDKVRFACYQRSGYVCEVCGGVGPDHPVECHEYWEWDGPSGVQKLVKLIALCPDCHHAVHLPGTMYRTTAQMINPVRSYIELGELYMNLVDHVANVNGCTLNQARSNLLTAYKQYLLRSRFQWKVNVDLVVDFTEQPTRFEMEGFEL